MARPTGKDWKRIGNVSVDSGMLMVCDPCYIDNSWLSKAPHTEPQGHPRLILTQKGMKKFPKNKDWTWQFKFGKRIAYDTNQKALGGLSVNDARDQGLVIEIPNPVINEFSYRGACSITDNKNGTGSVNETAAVFLSGYGDGCYEVWGRTDENNSVVEVRILMD